MLADEQASPRQLAIFRSMPGERRLELAEQLYWTARRWKTLAVQTAHPDWTEQQVRDEVRRLFANART